MTHGQFVVGQVDDLVGVAGQRRGVAGDEMLALADAHHQRAAQPGGDQHVRIIAKQDRQAVGSLELRQRGADGADQRLVVVFGERRTRPPLATPLLPAVSFPNNWRSGGR